jgi:CBS domain-containing protein
VLSLPACVTSGSRRNCWWRRDGAANVALSPEMPLEEAARLLVRQGLDAAPVVGPAREVIGLLSSRELLRHVLPSYVQQVQTGERSASRGAEGRVVPTAAVVRDAMARNVLCVSRTSPVRRR